MTTIAKILKTFTAGTLAFAILTGSMISSCTQKKSESAETEEAAGEHPTDGESEHPTEGGEHPTADSTATDSEHPTGAEHPTEEKK